MIVNPGPYKGALVKAKLYKGPFSGKVYTVDGRNEIVIRGDKPMTKKQRWEFRVSNPAGLYYPPRFPKVEARYKIAMRPHQNGHNLSMMPCQHPDGTIFYEYVEGSKREI